MTKGKWWLVLLAVLLLAGWIKLFYKTYNESTVSKRADKIIAIDTKRIVNTFIWQTISHPGRWKIKNAFTSSDQTGWEDIVEIPDFVFIFHVAKQPEKLYYSVFTIKDEEAFKKGLQQYHFASGVFQNGMTEYFADSLGFSMIRFGNHLLVGNVSSSESQLILQTATELFIKKSFIDKAVLQNTVNVKSHIALYIPKNEFLATPAIVSGNFADDSIKIACTIKPDKRYVFTEGAFNFSNSALCEFGFTQPSLNVYELLDTTIKTTISGAAGFTIDTLMALPDATFHLSIDGIQPKKDSAISYSYDDDFNKVEKVVVNNILEPSLYFSIKGDHVSTIFNYWKSNQKLEPTPAGDLFVLMPFVKSYCKLENDSKLSVRSYNYPLTNNSTVVRSICYLSVDVSKIPAEIKNYLPDSFLKILANIESARLTANKAGELILINFVMNKKKNDLPLIEF